MQLAPDKAGEWERSIHAISHECHALLSGEPLLFGEHQRRKTAGKAEDRRENVVRILQAAFAIAPEEWKISDELDAAQYFFQFCGCLGIEHLTCEGTQVEFIRGHSDDYLFYFTYGANAGDALKPRVSRLYREEHPFGSKFVFCVNYDPAKRNIDKPFTASFTAQYAEDPQTRYVRSLGSPYHDPEYEWSFPSRDECGRGDDVVPTDVKRLARWLRRRRKVKDKLEKLEKREEARLRREEKKEERYLYGTLVGTLVKRYLEKAKRYSAKLRREKIDRESPGKVHQNEIPLLVDIVFIVILYLLTLFIMRSCTR